MKATSLLFFSSSSIAVPLFEALCEDERFEILGLVCQPDKPAGRGQKLMAPRIKEVALAKGVPAFQPDKLSKANELLQQFTQKPPDFLLTFAYGQLLSETWLNLPSREPLNVHPSLLPLYRGPSPLEAALLHGDSKTGITLMRMVKEMDAGPVAFQKSFSLPAGITDGELYELVADRAAAWIPEAVLGIAENPNFEWRDQNEAEVSFCEKITKEDSFENFKRSMEEVLHRYQAYTPWPGLWSLWNGKRLKLLKLQGSEKKLNPGEVKVEGGRIFVGTETTALEVLSLQLEGKGALEAEVFLRGTPDFNRANLSS